MESTHELRNGQHLLLKEVSNSRRRYGLDDYGHMKGMVGKVWPIDSISSSKGISLYCKDAKRNFTFSIYDFERPEVKDPDPIIFEYDPVHLDI